MSVYAACAMLVIAGSLLWFVFTLYSDALAGKEEALRRFKIFARHTGEIFEQTEENDLARLQTQLDRLCRNYRKYVQTVLIRDENGVLFIWPQNTDVFSYTEQHTVDIKNLSFFSIAAQMHIPIRENEDTVTVHTVLQILPIGTIYNRGQIVFFLLMTTVLMTVIVLVFSYIDPPVRERNRTLKDTVRFSATANPASDDTVPPATQHEEDEIHNEDAFSGTNSSDTEPQQEELATDHTMPKTVKDNTEQTETEEVLPLSTRLEALNRLHIYDDDSSAVTQNDRTPPVALQESGEPEVMKEYPSELKPAAEQELSADKYGSFENHSTSITATDEASAAPAPQQKSSLNIPFANADHSGSHSLEQATLIEELATAITETAVAEEDLTLLLLHAPDISHNQQIIHLLRGTLDRIHKIFIFNKDTLGLIIFYATLDQSMQIASTLYDEVHALLDDIDKSALGIGFTTRAGRLIPAHRMIEEASAAIGKATEKDGDPIVAFRVNTDKYRRCLARLS